MSDVDSKEPVIEKAKKWGKNTAVTVSLGTILYFAGDVFKLGEGSGDMKARASAIEKKNDEQDARLDRKDRQFERILKSLGTIEGKLDVIIKR